MKKTTQSEFATFVDFVSVGSFVVSLLTIFMVIWSHDLSPLPAAIADSVRSALEVPLTIWLFFGIPLSSIICLPGLVVLQMRNYQSHTSFWKSYAVDYGLILGLFVIFLYWCLLIANLD